MMIDRYVPGRDRMPYRRRSHSPEEPFNRSSRYNIFHRPSVPDPYHGWSDYSLPVAQRSSPVSDDAKKLDTSLPKNFDKPLTCFFWHQFGRCNKRDIDCVYAHWDTGFMAGAPINLPGSSEGVAGKNAAGYSRKEDPVSAKLLADIQAREDALSKRELEIIEREKTIAKREGILSKKTRCKEKELGLREKKVARREEALRKAGGGGK